MDKQFLEECLAQGMSLEAIGEQVGKHPSTVSYWLKRYGLKACGADRHSPNGAVDKTRVARLVEEGASIRTMATEFDVGYSTMRYWLGRLGLETARSARKREGDCARKAGLRKTYLHCPKHGHAAFYARPEGGYRCAKCNAGAVSARRRQVKRTLVDEAGGCCRICGFAEHPAALHFHHIDPSTKDFHLAHLGASRSIRRMRAEAAKCILLCAKLSCIGRGRRSEIA